MRNGWEFRPIGPSKPIVALRNASERVEVAGSTGLEPAASGVTGRRSNQLNYDPAKPFECNRNDAAGSSVTRPVTVPLTNRATGGVKGAKDSRPLATARRAVAACTQACAAQPTNDHKGVSWWAVQDSNL